MQDHTDNKMHYLMALLLGIAGLLIILIFVSIRSQADTSSTTTTVANVDPVITISNISQEAQYGAAASSLVTVEETSTGTFVYGTISDSNGCADIDTLSFDITMYRSGVTDGHACTADDQNCYNTNSSGYTCSFEGNSNACDGGTDTDLAFGCTFYLQYFADPTDASANTYSAQNWIVSTSVADYSGGYDDASTTIELVQAMGIGLDNSSYSYGTLAFGGTSDDVPIDLRNTGNDSDQDIRVSSTDWTCSVLGTIDVGNLKWAINTTTPPNYNSMTAFTSGGETVQLNLAKKTATTDLTTATVHTRLQLPSSGLGGTCTSNVVVEAVAG